MIRHRSRWLRAAAVCGGLSFALTGVVAGLGATSAGALNGPSAHGAAAMIQQGNGECGANLSFLPTIGEVGFVRVGNEVTVTVSMQHAARYADYRVLLYRSYGRGSCADDTSLGYVYTNTKGNGFGIFSAYEPSNISWFFADPSYDGANDTPSVFLPAGSTVTIP